MEEDTRKLLEECNSGCKMAVSSMEQIQDYVTNKELDQVIAKSKENHQKLEADSTKLLKERAEGAGSYGSCIFLVYNRGKNAY